MFRRVLIVASSAAALVAATPAFAEQRDREPEPQKLAPCCERYVAQLRALEARVQSAEKKAADSAAKAAVPTVSEPRLESW